MCEQWICVEQTGWILKSLVAVKLNFNVLYCLSSTKVSIEALFQKFKRLKNTFQSLWIHHHRGDLYGVTSSSSSVIDWMCSYRHEICRPQLMSNIDRNLQPRPGWSTYIRSVNTFRTASKNFSFLPGRHQRPQTNFRSGLVLSFLCSFSGSSCPLLIIRGFPFKGNNSQTH